MDRMMKGPQNPRRSPQQTRAAQKERDIMQQMRDEEMSRRMQEAYERSQRRSVSGMKKGGKVKKYAAGGSASKRADGCAVKGKTRGKFV